MAIGRFVHINSSFQWERMSKLAPDLTMQAMNPENGELLTADELMGLAFVDQDGEQHIFVFMGDEGKRNLLAALTGGVEVATSMPIH